VTLDRRVLPEETLEHAQADVQRLLDQTAAERPGLNARSRATLLFPPLPPVARNALASTVQAVVRELGAGDGELAGATGATDAAWYAARGIPTVIYGPGTGATAHQPDECVALEDVRLGTRALTLAAARLVGGTGP
jgi:acetylornithine deacetylase/succinyl-diaminopimelate desuccinylase-like protein